MLEKSKEIITKERRQHTRIKESLTVILCSGEYLLENNLLSMDISEGGMCVLSPYKIEIGEIIELGIYLPKNKRPVIAVGEVVRRNETKDKKFPFLMGVKFIEISSRDYQQIRNHLRFYMLKT